MNSKLIALISIILFCALYRVLPHPPNIAPVAAMALFAGAHFQRRWLALIVPVIVMLISDVMIGFHNTLFYVYGGMLLTTCIGFSLRQGQSVGNVTLACLGATASFFLITNFGAWLGNPFYAQDFSGLMHSYAMGVPFMHYSLIGNALFTAIFFGGYALVNHQMAEQPSL